MSIYIDWGFTDSPFKTQSLPPSEMGLKLLVGRDNEKDRLRKRINNLPKLPTIEGLNGVGKTSLVNVVAYELLSSRSLPSEPIFLPCEAVFQLTPNKDVDEFVFDVAQGVLKTLIKHRDYLTEKACVIVPDEFDSWMTSPIIKSYQAGAFGINAGKDTTLNETEGFLREFPNIVFGIAEKVFKRTGGAIICAIDNLELLQKSDKLREMLEILRDRILLKEGLRFVLCGALGIVYGAASSPRLDGLLHAPISTSALDEKFVGDIFSTRIDFYKKESNFYLPITLKSFVRMFETLNGVLRSVLGKADDYCVWIDDNSKRPQTDEEKDACFQEWLDEVSSNVWSGISGQLRPRAIEVFKKAKEINGVFSPSDYDFFGFESIPAMRPHIKDLEDAGVVVSTQDEGDKRRKTIQITPNGWLALYHLEKA